MKKILALILALTLVFSLCLTSCKNVDDNKDKNDATKTQIDEKAAGIAAYNEYLEGVLSEFKQKEDLDKEILANVNGLPISAANVRYTYMVVDAPSEGVATDDEIKEQIELFYRENASLIDYANKNDIKLTEKDITSIEANITGMELQLGEEYKSVFAESPFTEFFYYFQTAVMQTLYSRIYEDTFADRESEITKSAFEQTKNDMVRAKHILIQFPEGEGENGALTEQQKADTLSRAEAVLAEVNTMSDISEFDDLIATYNEDPGMESNPDGYYFGKGEMVSEFEEAAYALEEGKTSGLVETSYGYHILLKLPLEDDEAIYNSRAFSDVFGTALYEEIIKDIDSFTVEYAENHDARTEDFAVEYEALMAAAEEPEAEAEAAPEAEAETETETETETEAETAQAE